VFDNAVVADRHPPNFRSKLSNDATLAPGVDRRTRGGRRYFDIVESLSKEFPVAEPVALRELASLRFTQEMEQGARRRAERGNFGYYSDHYWRSNKGGAVVAVGEGDGAPGRGRPWLQPTLRHQRRRAERGNFGYYSELWWSKGGGALVAVGEAGLTPFSASPATHALPVARGAGLDASNCGRFEAKSACSHQGTGGSGIGSGSTSASSPGRLWKSSGKGPGRPSRGRR